MPVPPSTEMVRDDSYTLWFGYRVLPHGTLFGLGHGLRLRCWYWWYRCSRSSQPGEQFSCWAVWTGAKEITNQKGMALPVAAVPIRWQMPTFAILWEQLPAWFIGSRIWWYFERREVRCTGRDLNHAAFIYCGTYSVNFCDQFLTIPFRFARPVPVTHFHWDLIIVWTWTNRGSIGAHMVFLLPIKKKKLSPDEPCRWPLLYFFDGYQHDTWHSQRAWFVTCQKLVKLLIDFGEMSPFYQYTFWTRQHCMWYNLKHPNRHISVPIYLPKRHSGPPRVQFLRSLSSHGWHAAAN